MDDWERAYNEEVERLIDAGRRCPECKAVPQKVEPVIYQEVVQVVCVNGHAFILEKEVDDG